MLLHNTRKISAPPLHKCLYGTSRGLILSMLRMMDNPGISKHLKSARECKLGRKRVFKTFLSAKQTTFRLDLGELMK